MPEKRRTPTPRSEAESLREYGRGVAGGLLFSLPLLYTMEVWQAAFTLPPHRQLAYLAGTAILLLGYNRYSGLHPETSWAEVVIDSVEELGIGLVLSVILLYALGRIEPGQQSDEILGRIVVEALVIAIGVSVGTAQLGGDEERDYEREVGIGGQLMLATCGAVLFAANVAPTEEIIMLGIELSPEQLIGLAVLSMMLSGLILYFSGFRGSATGSRRVSRGEAFRGIMITYAVSLVSSALVLWLFGRFDHTGLGAVVGQTVALGVAANLGASAGRLLLQQ